MSNRLSLFIIFCFVSISCAWGQCNKSFLLNLNEKPILYSALKVSDYRRYIQCESFDVNFQLSNINSENLKISWYRNDSLLNETSGSLKTRVSGMYKVQIKDGDCTYMIGNVDIVFVKGISLNLSHQELTICENITSSAAIYGYTNSSLMDITYQWQKDGKDIPGETKAQINPSTSGLYTLRATSGTCSATSIPVVVKASPNNFITDRIGIDKLGQDIINSDTLYLCKDYTYTLQSSYHVGWYLNEKNIAYGHELIPKTSGLYYTYVQLNDNCFLKSKPVYVSLDTKVSFKNITYQLYDECITYKNVSTFNPNFKNNSQVKFYDALTDNLKYSISTNNGLLSQWVNSGKYRIEYETTGCKSEPYYLDATKNSYPLISTLFSGRENVGGKKIELCNNSYTEIEIRNISNTELSLYRDGILVEKRIRSQTSNTSFIISKTGKYYIKATDTDCKPTYEVFSDTVEVVVAEPVSAILTATGTNCNAQTLTIKAYEGYTYSWYKDNVLLPDKVTPSLSFNANEGGTYYAVLQKGLCSVATQSITFGGKIKSISTICEGNKLVLEPTVKGNTYLWKGPDNFTSKEPIVTIESATPKKAAWYFLYTSVASCTFVDSLLVRVTPKPDVAFRILDPICLDNEVILEVESRPSIYTVDYNLYGSLSGTRSFSINSANEKKYISLGKLGGSIPANYSESFNLRTSTCNFPLTIQKSKPTICEDVVSFSNIREKYCNQEKITLQFNLPKNIPANTRFNLSLENMATKFNLGTTTQNTVQVQIPQEAWAQMYFVLASEDGKYVAISKTFNIIGYKPSILAINGSDTSSSTIITHCQGFATKLITYAQEVPGFQWVKDGVDIAGATKADFDAIDSGQYSIKSKYDGCAIESSSIEIRVGKIPKPTIESVVRSNNACNGYAVPLENTRNFSYTKYSWQYNGQVVEQKSENDVFEARKSGYYKLSAYQGACEETSDSIRIEIGQKLPNSIYTYGLLVNNKIELCEGMKADFYHSEYGISDTNEPQNSIILKKYGFNFQWKRYGQSIKGANNTSYSTSEPGVYYLQLTQGDCINNSKTLEIVRRDTLKAVIGHKYPFSDTKKTISLCKKPDNESYGFFVGQYYAGFSDWNIDLYKNGQIIETRTQIKGFTDDFFYIKESGRYSAKIYLPAQKSCIFLSDTAVFNIVDQPIRMVTDTIYSCADSVYLYPPDEGESYRWQYNNKVIANSYSLSVQNEGLYTVEVKQTSTCGFVQDILFQKKLYPRLTQSWDTPVNTSINLCEGEKVNLFVTNYGGAKMEWYYNQQKLPYNTYTISVSQAGNYSVKVIDKKCEAVSNTVKVDVLRIKNQISPLADSLGICVNGGFQLLEATKEKGYVYEWFRDNVSMEEYSPNLKANQKGIYRAAIQDGDCFALTPKVKIYPITQLPTATISGDTTLNGNGTANLKLSFTSSPPFTYKLSNNQEGISEKNTFIHAVKIQESTIFQLASVKNACGEGKVSGEAKISILILANEPLIGHKITIAPIPAENYCELIFDLPVSQEVSYQLLDMKGQQLAEKNLGNVTSQKQYLNLNQLTAGEYLIRIQVGKDFVTRKLIKQ